MDLIQGQSEQIMFIDELAKELGGIKIYKQVSVLAKKYQEALDAVMMVCIDPSKGLTDSSLEIAKQQNDSSFLEEWLGLTPSQFGLMASMIVAGVGVIGYSLKYRKRI